MSVVIDITMTPIQFSKDGKLYTLSEVIKDNNKLLITAEEVDSAPEFNEIIENI